MVSVAMIVMRATTVNNDTLQNFAGDGFIALRNFVGGEELSDVRGRAEQFIENVVPQMPPEQVFYEDKHDRTTLKQIQHLSDHDAWFRELFTAGQFREIAELLLDGPVVPVNMQYFNKPPGSGQPTPPHQDGYYFMLDPCLAVTMWLALDDVDEENGCVRYVRGSHTRGMRAHARTQTLGFSQGITDYPTDFDRKCELALSAQPGDLLVHHAMTIHRADGNQSASRPRRALGFIYYSAEAREDAKAHANYQRKLAEEMKAAGKI
jgi:phytanoyl-CoA hydroxylase